MPQVLDPRKQRRQSVGGYKPSPEEVAALQVVQDKFKPNDRLRCDLEQQWITNISFLRGFQYMNWDPVTRSLTYSSSPSLRWKSRLPNNLCRPYVRQLVSQVGSFIPRFKARPATNDPEDYQRADVSEKIVDHYWDLLRMQEKRWELLHWMKTTGNVFIKTYWDPEGGDPITEESEDGASAEQLFDGELESEIKSPFNIFADPYVESPRDVRWLMEVTARPIEWVEQHFPGKADLVPTGLGGQDERVRRRFLLGGSGILGVGSDASNDRGEDWCLVKEYWEKASRNYPRGRLIIEANGVILRLGDNPTPKGKLPYIWVRDDIVPGLLWGQCDLDNMIPLQRIYNRVINKQVEHVVNTANAKALQHSSNEIAESQWATETEVITWHGITPPQWLAPPPLGADVDNLAMQMIQNFDRVSSSFGPARGQYQGKVSGKAYLSLIEQDIQSKTPVIERLSEAMSEWAKMTLLWVKEYVTEPRLVRIYGRDKQTDVLEFQGADLDDNTDIRVDVDSMVPKSKAMALELLQYLAPGEKWLSSQDPDDRARVWKMLAMEDDRKIIGDKTIDDREARIENRRMLLGEMIEPPKPYENHDVHVMLHNEMRKSDEYKKADPIIRMMIDAHVERHLEIVMPQVGVTMPPQEETMMEGMEPPQRGAGRQPPQQAQQQQPQPTMRPYQ